MELKEGIKVFYAKSQNEWRKWLERNYHSEQSVWLIIYKKDSGITSVNYPEAVDQAICFGWIDSKPNKRDDKSYYQFFSKRNPKSNWSRINKEKAERLLREGLITPSGIEAIETAKQNGAWRALDMVEEIIIPKDLEIKFKSNQSAFKNWEAFPRSSKRGILEWILNAKRPETRQKRIDETVNLAMHNIKANHFRQ